MGRLGAGQVRRRGRGPIRGERDGVCAVGHHDVRRMDRRRTVRCLRPAARRGLARQGAVVAPLTERQAEMAGLPVWAREEVHRRGDGPFGFHGRHMPLEPATGRRGDVVDACRGHGGIFRRRAGERRSGSLANQGALLQALGSGNAAEEGAPPVFLSVVLHSEAGGENSRCSTTDGPARGVGASDRDGAKGCNPLASGPLRRPDRSSSPVLASYRGRIRFMPFFRSCASASNRE